MDHRQKLLDAGRAIKWVPPEMHTRYQNWVEGLSWDWAISRQRYFGVPFPVWYCEGCGEITIANEEQLPIDPLESKPQQACSNCGEANFRPETDVMDTWATSSVTPQIAGRWLSEPALYAKVFPMSLRPQAHDIIRTWAFYTIVKSLYHFDKLPWTTVAISGHGLSPTGDKISKSRSNGKSNPITTMTQYSADAVRYWAAGAGFGRDSWISEEQFKVGQKLVTKLWNIFRFSMTFLHDYTPEAAPPTNLTPTDKWLLAHLQQTIEQSTAHFEAYEFAKAKSTVETFFWHILADNYIEMAKHRLYHTQEVKAQNAARYTLYHALLSVIKLFAPIVPHITEEIYQRYFIQFDEMFPHRKGAKSIHLAPWPRGNQAWSFTNYTDFGVELVAIATAVRRFKSSTQRSLGAEFNRLILLTDNEHIKQNLRLSIPDIQSVTRAKEIVFQSPTSNSISMLQISDDVSIGIVV